MYSATTTAFAGGSTLTTFGVGQIRVKVFMLNISKDKYTIKSICNLNQL